MLFAERPDTAFRQRMRDRHEAMTAEALVVLFEWSPARAESAVAEMVGRLDTSLRDRLVHEGPLNLAARIAKVPPARLAMEPFVERVRRYNAEVRPRYNKEAAADYDKHIKPDFDKLRHG